MEVSALEEAAYKTLSQGTFETAVDFLYIHSLLDTPLLYYLSFLDSLGTFTINAA